MSEGEVSFSLGPVFGSEDGVVREAMGREELLGLVVGEGKERVIVTHHCWVLHCLPPLEIQSPPGTRYYTNSHTYLE